MSNIWHASDVAGTYGAIGGGGALGVGAQVMTLRNEKGAVLRLHGVQAGLQLNLDLSGLCHHPAVMLAVIGTDRNSPTEASVR